MGDGPMRFEILGPVRAWRDGHELDLGPAKQRAVLAVLLVARGRPVATDRIVAAVWQDEPPLNGANVVQKYVAGLRRVLEPGRSPRDPDQILARTDAGYLLRVPAEGVDADAFEARLRQGRAALADNRPGPASEHLREALAMWRGEALSGLSGPLFDGARATLADQRAEVYETWAAAELELGRHGPLAAELVRLVGEFPVRERLRSLLMLSLYRAGRQAEALAAYRDAHRLLADEYGVQPGDELRELHQRILRSDPPLTPPGPAMAAVPPAASVRQTEPEPAAWPTSAPAPIRWTTAMSHPAPPTWPAPVGAPARRTWPRALFAALVPLVTFGMATWALFGYLAGRRRSLPLAGAALGYLAFTVFFLHTALTTAPDGPFTGRDAAALMSLVVAWLGGTAHAALVGAADPVPAHPVPAQPVPAQPVPVPLQPGPDEDRLRRSHARELVERHPAIARELGIGRPDLPRRFADGGLIDVNSAPEPVLAALPGVGADRARRIAEDRERRGPYRSVAELADREVLPAELVALLADALVAVPPLSVTGPAR